MSKTDIWMPLYIADYLADTTRLTTEQHGAYLLLIMDYWRNGPLPDDDGALSQITRMQPAAWKKNRAMLVRLFRIEAGEWRHKRIDEELIEAAANAKKFADRAKKAAAKRWEKPSLPDASSNASSTPKAMLDQCTSPSPTPVNPSKQPPPVTDRESGAKKAVVAAVPSADIAIPETPTTEGHWMVWFNREAGTQFDASSRFDRSDLWPIFGRWCKAGITQQQMRVAIQTAQETATAPIANLPKYVDRVLANSQTPQRISYSDQSKLAASRAIFGTEIEGEQHGQSNRIIDVTPTVTEIGSSQDFSGDARKLRQPVLESVEDRTDHPGRH